MERPLTRRERIGLRLHLLICRSCKAFHRQIRQLEALVHRRFGEPDETPAGSPDDALSPEARERIATRLRDRFDS